MMDCEKNCYFCKYLCFLEDENVNGYFCTLEGLPYQMAKLNVDCKEFVLVMEE